MSKGSARRSQRVGPDVTADNWQKTFGRKWECRTLDGRLLGSAGTFEQALDIGLSSTPDDVSFSVREI